MQNPMPFAQVARPNGSGVLALALSTSAAAAPTGSTPPAEAPSSLPGSAGELFSEAFFLKLGFSFMIGLAMGFALKVAFKIAILAVGLILLALFAMQYNGLIDVNWAGLEPHYDSFAHGLSMTAAAFLDFAGDNLTSAVSFFAGLATGLRF